MDELDLLKKDWNKDRPDHKKLSVKDIYPMLHKKSSSIVKTLYYISIAELIFWTLLNLIPFFYSDTYQEKVNTIYDNEAVFTFITIVSYAIIFLFIYLLYKAYKSISVTDSAKKLMESILNTRKIIKYYVLYNLVTASISLMIGFYYALHNDPNLTKDLANFNSKEMAIVYTVIVIFSAIFVLIIWLFYKLIYGLLLKRLNKNYKELEKLDE